MITTIMGAVCALVLGTTVVTAPADTANVYVLNGEKIVNFDGSQLVGKAIKSYDIVVATDNATGRVSRIHTISASADASDLILHKYSGKISQLGKVVYVVDGKEVPAMEFVKINKNNIANMTVCKPGTASAKEWTKDDGAMVIVIETKKDNVYVIDGKKVSAAEFNKLSTKALASMTVLKAGSEAAKKWTDDGKVQVVMVDLKK